jgi:hypothetical protein
MRLMRVKTRVHSCPLKRLIAWRETNKGERRKLVSWRRPIEAAWVILWGISNKLVTKRVSGEVLREL